MKVRETILDFCNDGWGEDRLLAAGDLACVIDGATSITRVPFEGFHSNAEWMAETLARHVERCAPDGRSHPQVCREMVDQTAGAWASSVAEHDLPCLTTAAVRREGDLLKCWVLGDCSIYLLLEDGSVQHVTDRRIAAFYSRTVKAQEDARRRGGDVAEAVRQQRLHNKSSMNRPEGYWTVAYTGDFERRFVEYTVEADRIRGALLCTDGFDRLFDFGLADPGALLEGKLSLHHALELLRGAEKAREDAQNINVKRHDDVAAILLERV